MLVLKLLGGAALEDGSGRMSGVAAHRHSLALMARLVRTPARTLGRGKLVGLLWPGVPERTARNRLNTYVHRLRSELGADTLLSEGTSLRLNSDRVRCDVDAFQEALDEGRAQAAVEMYRGPFLDGFWIPDSPEFDQWMDRERDRLAREYREALRELAKRAWEEGDPESAAARWREIARQEPYDSGVTLRLMEALEAAGKRTEALRVADEHAQILEKELDAGPSEKVQALARRLRERPSRPAKVTIQASATEELDPHVVAILPFERLGGGEDGELLAVGLHQDLLTHLSRSDDLKVISRTSVIRYRDGRTSIPEIARALGAGTIVEGGLQYAGGRVRLNVQLVDGRRDEHRWAEIYDRSVTAESLFEIQTELAQRIAGSLQAELLAVGSRASEGIPPTRSLEAYRLQVQGRARLDERTEAGMRQAVVYFREALEEDPEYPLAWVGLADGLTLLYEYVGGYEPAGGGGVHDLREAEVAVRRALDLAPELGEAHASLGLLHEARHQGPDSLREHRRAVELQPSYAEAHNWLSWTSQLLGRPQEALAASRRAVELNPLSTEAVGNLAVTNLYTGDPVTALRELRRANALQPDWDPHTFYEALILHRLGRTHEAKDLLRGLTVLWAGSGAESTLALLQAVSGEAEAAREALAGFEAEEDHFAAGVVRVALGDRDGALEVLTRVERWAAWPTLAMHFHFPDELRPLREDPRFDEIMTRVHDFWGLKPDGSLPEEG
jgi:DNA-binding SARP family transcriptional activator/tetratricopeptide (TPR) repeat protein